ncbi:hypothetical protein NECID01_0368 [Nematocida sp. AWRm77]|nr:hypothetical protein NECID01_0368 [Nematocida sp. AWRm77]
MFAYLPEKDPCSILSIVMCAIEQELSRDAKGCEMFGRLLGEKIAEELAFSLPGSACLSFAEVATAHVLPAYFEISPLCTELPPSPPYTQKHQIFLRGLPLEKFCEFQAILDILYGTFSTLSQNMFSKKVQVRKTKDALLISE